VSMTGIYSSFFVLAAMGSERDTSGICGGIFHYSLILAFMGSALLSFVYFWSKGRLDMDEAPKIQMMTDDEHGSGHDLE